jgi:hypothetical protein
LIQFNNKTKIWSNYYINFSRIKFKSFQIAAISDISHNTLLFQAYKFTHNLINFKSISFLSLMIVYKLHDFTTILHLFSFSQKKHHRKHFVTFVTIVFGDWENKDLNAFNANFSYTRNVISLYNNHAVKMDLVMESQQIQARWVERRLFVY